MSRTYRTLRLVHLTISRLPHIPACKPRWIVVWKRANIRGSMMEGKSASDCPRPIDGVNADAEYAFPTSFSQERIWFFEQLYPNTPVYHLGTGLRLRAPAPADVVIASVDELVRRHDALRTSFALEGDAPVQIVREHARAEIEIV